MNLNQTYPKVAVLSGFILFRIKARKLNKQTREQMTKDLDIGEVFNL